MFDFARDPNRFEHGTRARYNGARCRCFKCRRANAAYELARQRDPRVPADVARAHLLALSAKGIGRRAVEAATDIDDAVLQRIIRGERARIPRSMEAKILAVDESAASDHALVPATETRRMLRELLRLGFTKTSLAAKLGSEARVPALQIRETRVLAKTELRVRRLYDVLMAGEDDAKDEAVAVDESPRARILRALRFFEAVEAQDLFDAMDVSPDDRGAYEQALHRLAKSGEVERMGARRPFEYRLPPTA
jgi:hypothetical protein